MGNNDAVTVAVKVSGGQLKELKGSTLGEIRSQVNAAGYQAQINGEPTSSDTHRLRENDFIIFTAAVKGA